MSDILKVCEFTSKDSYNYIILEDVECETIYIINKSDGVTIIINEVKNMIYNVCDFIYRNALYDDLYEIYEGIKSPYKEMLVEMAKERMTYNEYIAFFEEVQQ